MPRIILFGFALTVVIAWFRSHFFTANEDWLVISFPLLASALLFIALLSFFRRHAPVLHIRRFTFLFGLFLLAVFIFNSEAFLVGFLPGRLPVIPFTDWASANSIFAFKLSGLFATFLILTGIGSALGQLFLRRPDNEEPTKDGGHPFLVSLAIGLCAGAIILHTLGLFGWLNPTAIWVIVFAIGSKEWRSLRSLIRWLFGKTEWRLKLDSSMVIILALGLFLSAQSLVEAVRPDPTGYDDMTTYMNRANIMSERQALIPISHPFPFELLAAAIRIATADETLMLAMSLGVYALLFGAVIIYAFGRAVFNHRTGLIAVVTLLSVPMASALAIREVKPDSLLLPIAALFFWSLFRWIKERERRFLLITLFLFGFAITIKLTALFLIAPLVIGLVIGFCTVPRFGWPSFRNGLLAGLFFLLPILSWTLSFPTLPTRPGEIPFSLPTLPAESQKIPASDTSSLSQDMSLLIDHTSCMATGSLEDFARFKTERGNVMQTLLLPWDITLNRQVGSPAAETGPLFLALLPLGLMLGSPRHRSFDRSWFEKPTVILASFAFAYGLSWLLFAKQVPWYGYPGLALLALLAARVMEYSDSQPFLRRCLFIVLILGLIGNTLQQMEFSGQSGQIRSAGGLIDRLDYLETSFPSYLTVTEILNFNPTDRVYITGSRLLYGIRDNDRRALLDTRLDNFNCLANEDDPETTLAAMRSLRVRYILFSRSLLQELTGDYPSTLREKVVRFTDFSGQHLSIVWGSADYMLFEVPRDSK